MLCKGYSYRHERPKHEGQPFVATSVYRGAQHVVKHYMGSSSSGMRRNGSSSSSGISPSGSSSNSPSGNSSNSPVDASNYGAVEGRGGPPFFNTTHPRTMRVLFVLRRKGEDRELLNEQELLQHCRQWRPSIPRLSARLMHSARQHADHGVWFAREAVGYMDRHIGNISLTVHVLSSALQAADPAKGGGGGDNGTNSSGTTAPLDAELLAHAVIRVALALQACHIRRARTEAVLAFLELRVAEAVEADPYRQPESMHEAGDAVRVSDYCVHKRMDHAVMGPRGISRSGAHVGSCSHTIVQVN